MRRPAISLHGMQCCCVWVATSQLPGGLGPPGDGEGLVGAKAFNSCMWVGMAGLGLGPTGLGLAVLGCRPTQGLLCGWLAWPSGWESPVDMGWAKHNGLLCALYSVCVSFCLLGGGAGCWLMVEGWHQRGRVDWVGGEQWHMVCVCSMTLT